MANTADSVSSHSHSEQHFVKIFVIVLAALVAFTAFCFLTARLLAGRVDGGNEQFLRNSLMQRIQPVGQIRTSPEEAPAAGSEVAAAKSPAELAQGACAACHAAGVAGAPKFDDDAAWAARRELGLDALVASVINGKGGMPARGASAYSDDEIRQAVAYMAGFDTGTDSGAAAATEADTDAAAAEDSTATTAAAAATTATAAAPTTAVAAASERVKTITDGVCVACHLSGVGGAPKIGDKEAWAARAEKGMDGMVAVAAAGKGAMPPRGGTDLDDAELASSIQYLMSK